MSPSRQESDEHTAATDQASEQLADDLADRFGRLEPRGTPAWVFSAALGRLEQQFDRSDQLAPLMARALAHDAQVRAGTAAPVPSAAGGDAGRRHGASSMWRVRQAARRAGGRWLGPVVEARARRAAIGAAGPAAREAVQELCDRGDLGEAFRSATQALRYLAARVEVLEQAARRRGLIGVDLWEQVDPPDLSSRIETVVGHLMAGIPSPRVLHAECGHGELVVALKAAGFTVTGADPRSAVAWSAASRGLPVHLSDTAGALSAADEAGLGAVVLSGAVDRSSIEDLLALIELASTRLVVGGALVVTGSDPGTSIGRTQVAGDLLPGRPLHAETWEYLLVRSGLSGVRCLDGPVDHRQARADGADPTAAGVVVVGRVTS